MAFDGRMPRDIEVPVWRYLGAAGLFLGLAFAGACAGLVATVLVVQLTGGLR